MIDQHHGSDKGRHYSCLLVSDWSAPKHLEPEQVLEVSKAESTEKEMSACDR